MKYILNAMVNQLTSFPDLSYAKDTGYVAQDPWDLVDKGNFPFFNVIPGDERIVRGIDDMPKDQIERHIYPVTIQFAQSSMNLNVAIMGDVEKGIVGILDMSDNIWDAINYDRTLGGVVEGIEPNDSEVSKDFLRAEDNMFLAQAEIMVEFYKDVALV